MLFTLRLATLYTGLLTFSLTISLCTNAQGLKGSVKGKIIDKVTKQAIAGANVVILGTHQGTQSDSLGIFVLTDIPEGSYLLRITFIGYTEKILTDIQVTRNKIYYAEVELMDASRLLDVVELVAHKYENDPRIQKISMTAFIDIVNVLNRKTENAEIFQPLTGRTYYDGSEIFPTFGISIEK